jgi:hypothetical protein
VSGLVVSITSFKIKNNYLRPAPWLTLVILTTWEANIRRIEVQDQPGQIVHETPSPK